MLPIVLATILFGLVHPGSKVILGTGIDLISFCLLYILIRLVAQTPLVLKKKHYIINSKKLFLVLLALGIAGALLQYLEFFGISEGLPVPVVTFLVFSNPIWTTIISVVTKEAKINVKLIARVTLGLVGIYLITNGTNNLYASSFIQLLPPIAAGVCISFWVVLSSKARKLGASVWTISYYYDLFAFIALGSVFLTSDQTSLIGVSQWLQSPTNAGLIVAYSIFIGLLPNILFYKGSGLISPVAAGLILLLEPVISSLVSATVWGDPLGLVFVIGAGLVLLSALEMRLTWLLKHYKYSRPRLGSTISVILLLFALTESGRASTIYVVDIVPVNKANYIVSDELQQIKAAVLSAKEQLSNKNGCASKTNIEFLLKNGTSEDLFKTIKTIAKNDPQSIVIGLSRSNFARIAAKASVNSPLKVISIGASTTDLKGINPNTYSVASPWLYQWQSVNEELTTNKCDTTNTYGIFNDSEHLSNKYKELFLRNYDPKKALNHRTLKTKPFKGQSNLCFFIPLNFGQSRPIIPQLLKAAKAPLIIGMGDWNIFSDEINSLLKELDLKNGVVKSPTGWVPEVSKKSKWFSHHMKHKFNNTPSPIAAYAFDGASVAINHLCKTKNKPLEQTIKESRLLRNYKGITEFNNFNSPMLMVTFGANK